MRAFDIEGVDVPVLVVHQQGRYHAAAGVCPHEEVVALEDGKLRPGQVVCHAHGYCFELESGRCKPDEKLRLAVFEVELVGEEIWIQLFSPPGH